MLHGSMRALSLLLIMSIALALTAAAAKPTPERPTPSERTAAALEQMAGRKPEPVAVDVGCTPPSDRRSSDLCAQWKAADAARLAARAALITIPISILTLLGLAGSLEQGRQALKEARVSREDAGRAAETELRAYIQAKPEAVWIVNQGHHRTGTIKFRADTTNTGLTPAREVQSQLHVRIQQAAAPEPVNFEIFGQLFVGPAVSVGRDSTISSGEERIDRATLAAILAGRTRAFMASRVTYRDVFPNSPLRHSYTAWEILFDPGELAQPGDFSLAKATFNTLPLFDRYD